MLQLINIRKISCNNQNVKENTLKNTGLDSIDMALEGGHYATWTKILSMLHTSGFIDVYNNLIGEQTKTGISNELNTMLRLLAIICEK